MPWPVPPEEAINGHLPLTAPPSEATTRMFAALSPESLESESREPESLASSRRPTSSGRSEGGGVTGRDDRVERPRRLRRLALVSGLSVLVAVGVTTGGARLIAGRTSLTMEQTTTACPASADCAAAGASHAEPGSGESLGGTPVQSDSTGDPTGDPVRNGQEDSGETGADEGEQGQKDAGKSTAGQDKPARPRSTPAPTAKGRDRDHTAARTRTPSTAAPRASAQASAQAGDAPVAVAPAGEGTENTVPDGDAQLGEDAPGDSGSTEDAAGTDAAGTGTDTARTESAFAGGPAVRVGITVTRRAGSGYTARLAVRNEGPALPAWTIRLAVGGQVTAVEGADWRQQGNTLILSSQTALGEGGTLTLTVRADGASAAPADCVLSEGRCEVSGPGPSRRRG
ncbi:hypothetical protein AB0O28_25055 [Microbispora sp. NPDC088329]|uniref:hypothetical protein n=1 Tax=Microbispora sp. NPDC088329 TaxID=3154869 RepID=UPI003449F420